MAVAIRSSKNVPLVASKWKNLVTLVSGSITQPQHKYILDIYRSGSNELITRMAQPANGNGDAVFNIGPVLEGEVTPEYNWTIDASQSFQYQIGSDFSSCDTFTLQAGEVYGTSPSSSLTVYSNIDSGSWGVYSGTPTSPDAENVFGFGGFATDMDTGSISVDDYITIGYRTFDLYPVIIDIDFYNGSSLLTSSFHSSSNGDGIEVLGIGRQSTIYGGTNIFETVDWDSINIRASYPIVSSFNDSIWYQKAQPCFGEDTSFAWINRLGFWDYTHISNPIRQNTSLEREKTYLPPLQYSGTPVTYYSTPPERGIVQTFLKSQDTYSIDTDYITQAQAEWLEQMIESDEVYIQKDGQFFPIIITNSEYTHNNSTSRNKLFKFTIEFRYANPRRARV